MIKLICPKCMKPVPVADDFTGKEVTCPNCMKAFDAPARYNPAVIAEPTPAPPPVPPAKPPETIAPPTQVPIAPEPRMSPEVPPEKPVPPPGFVLPPPPVAPAPHAAPPGLVLASSASAPTPQMQGYTHAYGITISPKVIVWLPAVLLTITFFCTFFRWTGSYLGGHPVYSQSPWQAIFAGVSRNFALEVNMPGSGAWLDKVASDWALLVPYMLLLMIAAGIAWADRGFRGIDPRRFPPIAGIWPWRKALIGVLASLALILVTAQLMNGFGMERAIRKMVRENPDLAKAREDAAGSPAKLAAVENKEDSELAKYNLEETGWRDLALFCNLLAIVTVFLSIPMEKRGDRPPPRIVLHY
ncbi:MAG: hypothetical protein C0467_31780 [Planctomycetaceae bacterium]|nr:hypothetical protein [Planctomycetaceae bacterium]